MQIQYNYCGFRYEYTMDTFECNSDLVCDHTIYCKTEERKIGSKFEHNLQDTVVIELTVKKPGNLT